MLCWHMLMVNLNILRLCRCWGVGRRWMCGEAEHQTPNKSVFFCRRLEQPERDKSISNFHSVKKKKKSSIFSKIRQNISNANMLRRYGRVTQLGWNRYALSPWASFDYVPLPFIAVSKSEFAIVRRVGRRREKKKKRRF